MTQSRANVLITGGAGFIGSHLVENLISDARVSFVRVLDDLSTGEYENIKGFIGHDKFEFIEGDICDQTTVEKAVEGMNIVSHQAALGSVPRSIENPKRSNDVNIGGTLNVLCAAKKHNIDRVILAFSSSTYGDHPGLPKVEGKEGKPLSPYAVTKSAIEQYAEVFGEAFGLNWIGLRYFNVFGPRQQASNPYAAVIPKFVDAFMKRGSLIVNGDGLTSRDFTYISNVVDMNKLAMFTTNEKALNETYNTACSHQTTLNQIVDALVEEFGFEVDVTHGEERAGDVRHSLASIDKASNLLGYSPKVDFRQGLKRTIRWFKDSEGEDS